jgi:hypothetical protein
MTHPQSRQGGMDMTFTMVLIIISVVSLAAGLYWSYTVVWDEKIR